MRLICKKCYEERYGRLPIILKVSNKKSNCFICGKLKNIIEICDLKNENLDLLFTKRISEKRKH